MSALPKSDERRAYRRVSDAIAMQIHLPDEAANERQFDVVELPDHPTHVVSLSPNGLKCYHDEAFSDGDVLQVSIRLFPSGLRIDTEARVVNSGEDDKPNKNNRFFAGLAFVKMPKECKAQLLEHIQCVAKESFGGAVKLVNR